MGAISRLIRVMVERRAEMDGGPSKCLVVHHASPFSCLFVSRKMYYDVFWCAAWSIHPLTCIITQARRKQKGYLRPSRP